MSTAGNVTVTVDDAEWRAMIRRMSELTGKTASKIVTNTAKDYTRAAAKATPVAKKISFRPIEINGQRHYIPVSPPRYPRGFGFARLGWFRALESLGVKMRKPNPRQKFLGAGIFDRKQSIGMESTTVGNAVSYIGKLDQEGGIDRQGQQAAWVILTRSAARYEQQMGALANG